MEKKRPESAVHSRVTRSSSRKGKGFDKTPTWIERRERRKISFEKRRPNIIGKNDLIVNTHTNKIKLEAVDDMQVVVKEENDNLMESVNAEMEDIALINEDGRVKMEYGEVRVVTDDIESLIRNVPTDNQDSGSSNNLHDIRQPEDRSDPASAKTTGNITETVYKAKFLSLKRRNQGLLRTLKQKNSLIRVLTEKMEQLELQLFEATSKIVTFKDNGKTDMTVDVGTEKEDDLQSSVCHVNNEIYQSVSPGPSPIEVEAIQHETSPFRSVSPNYALVGTEMVIQDKEEQENKAVDVFEQVVRILIHNVIQADQVDCTDEEMFKNCRLVCKSWKESVDRALQNDPSHMTLCSDGKSSLFRFKKDFTPPCSTIIRKNQSMKKQFTKTSWSKLQSYVVDYPSFNPIINGHLMIDVVHKISTGLYPFGECFWIPFADLVHDFLEAFGAKVFYLTVRFRISLIDVLDRKGRLRHFSNSLLEWLNLTPNVKSLCMEFDIDGDTSGGYESMILDVPHMKDLTVIQDTKGLVLYSILSRNQQICKLRLNCYIKEIDKILEMNFPNLSELVMSGIYYSSDVSKLKSVMWPVQRLTLIHPLGLELTNVLSSEIKNTLQYLTLEVGKIGHLLFFTYSLDTELNLPLLTQLIFRIPFREFDGEKLEAVLKLLNLLETLEIELISTEPYHYHHGVNLESFSKAFLGFVEKQSEASYWKCLPPNLKRIKFIHVIQFNNAAVIHGKVIERDDIPAECFS